MYYEVNVSLNGKHLFATAERSLTTREEVAHVLAEFDKVFTEERGFVISVSYHENSGEILDPAPFRALAAAIDWASGS